MPHVQTPGQVKRSGQKNKTDIKKASRKAIARDDLRSAFAGNENKGPASNEKVKSNGTHLKSRVTKHSKTKTPKR